MANNGLGTYAVQYQYGDTNPIVAPILLAQEVNIGDIVGESALGNIYRAEDETWDTDYLTTVQNFVENYLGLSGQLKESLKESVYGNSTPGVVRVDTSAVFQFPCAAHSYKIGDYVQPAQGAGNYLVSQAVAPAADVAHAIGVVTQATVLGTTVLVRLLSTKMPLSKAAV